jgi:hypothetical protein
MRSRKNFNAAVALFAVALVAATAPAISITGQLLAYQDGFVFFTSGDGFHVSPSIQILDDRTHHSSVHPPAPRDYARAVFDDAGQVVELDLSRDPLPVEPLPDAVRKFVVVASSPYPNPELGEVASRTANGVSKTYSGKPVLVTISVEVPPTTPLNSQIFIATEDSQWNPQAIQLDRVDALHFRVTRRIASGTVLRYIYTRGSFQTEERGENGLDRSPHLAVISDADVRTISDVVSNWADISATGRQQYQPNILPTPYNPAPFPNLPPGAPTPHPRD